MLPHGSVYVWLLDRPRSVESLVEGVNALRGKGFECFCVPPFAVGAISRRVGLEGIRLGSVAGYALGISKPTVKAIEASSAVKDGAEVVYVTPNWGWVLEGLWGAMRDELTEVARAARAANPESRLILDLSGRVMEAQEVRVSAGTAMESGFDGVLTGEGLEFSPEVGVEWWELVGGGRVERRR